MKKYALLFSISLVFFLIGNLPASLFASSIQSPYLLEGSVWQGHTNNPKFGKIDWSFSPLALFQAKLGEILSGNNLNFLSVALDKVPVISLNCNC
jgi:hypothetical protein